MISLQAKIKYAGRIADAPASRVLVAFEFPAYRFVATEGDRGVSREETGDVLTWELTQSLTDTEYRVAPGNTAVTGEDPAAIGLATKYYVNALKGGNTAELGVPVMVRFFVAESFDLQGPQRLDAVCVPVGNPQAAVVERMARLPQPPGFVLLNRAALDAVTRKIAPSDQALSHKVALHLISAMVEGGAAVPRIVDKPGLDLRGLVQGVGLRGTAAEVKRIVQLLVAASNALFEFELVVPEIRLLDIAGTLTIVRTDATAPAAADFRNFEILAECAYDPPGTRSFSYRFGTDVTVTEGSAPFALTADHDVLLNGLRDPVRVSVKGLETTVWTRDFRVTDPALAQLDIEVQVQAPVTLNPVPPTAEPDRSKKLRGQVLTFQSECSLKGALVVIQAKTNTQTDWHIVAAGTTDSTGNFTVPYPYGTFSAARAVVSLAPEEAAPVAVVGEDPNTVISEDFLYLLLKSPKCPSPKPGVDCGCESGEQGNRLPDHEDLIGSDIYSQDIGGSCVNLSKPNRTINEYGYQAIVRTSDPDVANYTLTRYETGLESIDVSVLASLASGAAALQQAAAAARADADRHVAEMPTVFAARWQRAVAAAMSHVNAVDAATGGSAPPITLSVLGALQAHVESVVAIMQAYRTAAEIDEINLGGDLVVKVIAAATALQGQVALSIDTVGTAVRYELTGGSASRQRRPVTLDNPVLWQDAPEPAIVPSAAAQPAWPAPGVFRGRRWAGPQTINTSSQPPGQPAATFAQAVSVATGHILHFKAVVKADGYSLGDLIYSLPLAPGQKKEIVVFESSRALAGAETQTISQNERLAMGLVSEREITDELAGSISESVRGSSRADTAGISAGFGTAGQGSGGTGAYGGSGSAVIGVAGGWAQATSNAAQDSSRTVAQYFGERLRQSIMQNAEGYRRLNASVVTTVQEGQRYGVTSEVIANHNHCHALTMMYFEVLRHFAVYQQLAAVEECVFVPLLLTRFTTENIAKWRDVLAPALLPLPSDSYLQPHAALPNVGRQHPLLKAFDADQRIRTHYANADVPAGAYDEERIQYIRGSVRLRVNLPRPRTRFDRILSFPVVKRIDTAAAASAAARYASDTASYAAKAAFTLGIYTAFAGPDTPSNPEQFEVVAREALADAFMRLDANFETVPPAECMRITDFKPKTIAVGPLGNLIPRIQTELDFFAENSDDKAQWALYSQILGYPDVGTMLNAHFRGNLIAEWDSIFRTDIAPLVFEKILDAITLDQFATDFSSPARYYGGEQAISVNVTGTTSKSRNQLPLLLDLSVRSPAIQGLKKYISLTVESVSINYATSHYNGVLFHGGVGDDLLDGTQLPIPENAEEKRNPRREDRYLAAKLIEHLNTNLEHYNKVLWYRLDPDRRYMLLDGFSIQVYDTEGRPLPAPAGLRSLATVVKNDVIAVAGNSLVLPVAPGYRVSGSFLSVAKEGKEQAPTLMHHYRPLTPVPPYRISVPSKGVFAEAVQGACNACEKIETDRLQDWNRYPIGDQPPGINPVTVPTPGVTDWRAAIKDFAAPIVNVQNAPAAPVPGAGLAGLAELLGRSEVFRDISGLDANQQNAIRTYLSNQENVRAFGQMAKEMAMQQHNTQNTGKIMDSIASAKQSGDLTQEDAGKLVKGHLQQQIDGGASTKAELETREQTQASPLTQAAVDAARQGKPVTAQKTESDGTTESVEIGSGTAQPETLEDNLSKYSTAERRAFDPGSGSKSGVTVLRAVVPDAAAGSTWHWAVSDATKAQIKSPMAYITEVVAGHPGLVDLTFEAVGPDGSSIARTASKLSVPQFIAIEEEAAMFNAELTAYHLDDVREAVLRRAKDVVDFLLRKANVRTVWTIPPFNETLPAQFAAGGFAAGKYNTLTLRGTNAAEPEKAGAVGAAGAGAAKPDEPIDIWPGAFRNNGMDVGVEVSALVKKMAALNITDPVTKTLWIEIMGRLIGENMAHEIHHALLAFAIPTGHNAPAIPWDLMNRGSDRPWIQRTGIEIIDGKNFPDPNTYVDGGMWSISGVQARNQALVDSVFPVPPAFK